MRRMLFLSSAMMIRGLIGGEVYEEDLSDGLFYLDSDWLQKLNSMHHRGIFTDSLRRWAEQVLTKAMTQATDEGRLLYFTPSTDSNPPTNRRYIQLNSLLVRCGFVPLDFSLYKQMQFDYAIVKLAVENQGHPLEVYP